MKIDVVKVELCKSHSIEIDIECNKVYGIETAKHIFCSDIGNSNIELVSMLCLDNTNRVINYSVISMGNINNVKVSLSQMFKIALLSNASKIIVAHNHPSGILKITNNDINLTRKIGSLAADFGIEFIDSIVVNGTEAVSIRRHCKEFLENV